MPEEQSNGQPINFTSLTTTRVVGLAKAFAPVFKTVLWQIFQKKK